MLLPFGLPSSILICRRSHEHWPPALDRFSLLAWALSAHASLALVAGPVMGNGSASLPRLLNVYALWLKHKDDSGGLWLRRNSWTTMVVHVVWCAPLLGEPPYYGNPNPEVKGKFYRLDGQKMGLMAIRCPGTFAYERVEPPEWSFGGKLA